MVAAQRATSRDGSPLMSCYTSEQPTPTPGTPSRQHVMPGADPTQGAVGPVLTPSLGYPRTLQVPGSRVRSLAASVASQCRSVPASPGPVQRQVLGQRQAAVPAASVAAQAMVQASGQRQAAPAAAAGSVPTQAMQRPGEV